MSASQCRPLSDDESEDDSNYAFDFADGNLSTHSLVQGTNDDGTSVHSSSASSPLLSNFKRPASRYSLIESEAPITQSFDSGREMRSPDVLASRPTSIISNMTEDWIQRQQPIQASQAHLWRYQTRRVRLNARNVFSADYPYYPCISDCF